MINQKTWPNHRMRSDRDAVKAINDSMGIKEGHDLEYGRTKCKSNSIFKVFLKFLKILF